VPASILIVGLFTIISALIIQFRMHCSGNSSVKVLQWLFKKMYSGNKVNTASR
jgi:hypothetical protein